MKKRYIIPDVMTALGIDNNRQVIIKKIPVPKPGNGEVLVKIAAAPVNPSDIARIRHVSYEAIPSFVGGIEGSGVVVDYGKGLIPRFLYGKRVACSASGPTKGSWAEYMVAPAMGCIPLPKDISDEQGSMMLVNPLTATAFFNIIHKGRHKAVINTAAAGALGKMISHLAGKYGIKVIHVVHNQMQANNLRTNGIQYIADSSAETFEDDLKLLASQHQASLALDAVGGQMTRQLIMAMPYGGSVIIYGNLSGENPVTDHRTLIDDNKCISGFYLVNWLKEQNIFTTLRCISTARKMLKKGIQIPVQSRFDFNEMQTGIETYLGNMTSGKVLLIPGMVLPK